MVSVTFWEAGMTRVAEHESLNMVDTGAAGGLRMNEVTTRGSGQIHAYNLHRLSSSDNPVYVFQTSTDSPRLVNSLIPSPTGLRLRSTS
jgi:hypothetical protein